MEIAATTVTTAQVSSMGMGFYELFLGAETYAAVRSGEDVVITTADGTVNGKVQSVQIGPLAQFFAPGQPHLSNLGRGHDVRNIADALEARYPVKTKGNEKALDPRTIYTAVFVSVPYVPPAPIPSMPPVAA